MKNVFLHEELDEEIYMNVPPGYCELTTTNIMCKLKKTLYGLKQSPRAWFGRFTKFMIGLAFKQSQGDHTLFIKHSETGGVTFLLVYVDDIIVTGDDEKEGVHGLDQPTKSGQTPPKKSRKVGWIG